MIRFYLIRLQNQRKMGDRERVLGHGKSESKKHSEWCKSTLRGRGNLYNVSPGGGVLGGNADRQIAQPVKV